MPTYEKATQVHSSLLSAVHRADSASRGLPTTQGGIDRLKDGQSMLDAAWQAYHAGNPKVDPELPAAIRSVIYRAAPRYESRFIFAASWDARALVDQTV